MTDVKITDPTLATTLRQASEPMTIWGPEGVVIGYFSPAKPSYRHIAIPLDEEELRRREQDDKGPWIPAEQVLAKLQELKKCTG
jgi:hypothetical protein